MPRRKKIRIEDDSTSGEDGGGATVTVAPESESAGGTDTPESVSSSLYALP